MLFFSSLHSISTFFFKLNSLFGLWASKKHLDSFFFFKVLTLRNINKPTRKKISRKEKKTNRMKI